MAEGSDSDEEKTLEPSEKKKQQFLEEGKVPRSQEIQGAAGLAVGFGALILLAPAMAEGLVELGRSCWTWTSVSATDPLDGGEVGARVLTALAELIGPPLAIMWLGSLVVGMAQSRMIIPKEPLKLDWDRVNPLTNAKQKFFSSQPFVEAGKGIAKILLLGAAVWMAIEPRLNLLPALTHADPTEALETMRDFAVLVLLRCLPIAAVIAAVDYAYQAYRLHEQMKMSHQELKEEHKRSEGDPQLKAARRRRQIELSRAVKAIEAVPQADVIITNPTHFSIALRYRPDEAPAPIVLARGVDHLALKMQAVARQHDVPRVENRPLARALYAQCKEGQMIPEDLFGAVADILGIIYRRRGRPWQKKR